MNSNIRLYHCDVCSIDCTNRIRIQCAECEDYDLCVPCFRGGMSSGSHKSWHDYRVIERNTFPIFDEDWGADEEYLLIQGCEMFGIGNWKDIADHIGNRTAIEVSEHYESTYLDKKFYPLPDINKDFLNITPSKFLKRRKMRLEEQSTVIHNVSKIRPVPSVPLCHEIQGYMPGRLEFDQDAEEENENLIKDIVFESDELSETFDLKLTIFDIYNSKLTSRIERKRIMILNNLLDYRKNIMIDKKKTKEEKDLFRKICAFIKILTPNDFLYLSHNFLKELRCRMRIYQLQSWRKIGITSLEDGNRYEKDKLMKISHLQRMGNVSLNTRNFNYGFSGPNFTHENKTGTYNPKTVNSSNSPASLLKKSTAGININVDPKQKTQTSKFSFDIVNANDFELLSKEEIQLCSMLRILPKPYLAIKHHLVTLTVKNNGVLKKNDAKQAFQFDSNKILKIYNFFVRMGWCFTN